MQTEPTIIHIEDEPLPNGRRHSLRLTVWTVRNMSNMEQEHAVRTEAIGFLERALAELRHDESSMSLFADM